MLCVMEDLGVRELRQNLSVYLRRVKAGETFEVTERGRPVALLSPLTAPETELEQMVRTGRARPASRPLADLPAPVRLPDEAPSAAELLNELRTER